MSCSSAERRDVGLHRVLRYPADESRWTRVGRCGHCPWRDSTVGAGADAPEGMWHRDHTDR